MPDWNYTVALATLIITFCSLLDWLVSRSEEEKAKSRLTELFVRLDDYRFRPAINALHEFFNRLFSAIYGKSWRTWRFFIASALSSYFAIALVATLFLATGRFGEGGIENDVFQAMIGMSLLVNVWGDIASLIETRWILRQAEGKPLGKLILFLLFDLAFSALLFLAPFYLLLSLGEGNLVPVGEVMRDVFSLSRTTEPHIQVMFISTFFASAMFYAFMVLALLAWLLGIAKTRLLVLIERLEASNHLFKSIGGLLTAVLGVAKGIYEVL